MGAAFGDKNSTNNDPNNRSKMSHIANILMQVDRLDPNSNVQCEIARDTPPSPLHTTFPQYL